MADNKIHEIAKYVIVGSGPSGVAVAEFLISRGFSPLIIDGGVDVNDVPIDKFEKEYKTWFGSSASYHQPARSTIAYDDDLESRASFARGGFSRVWGATFSFPDDYSLWPPETIPTDSDIEVVRHLVPHATTSWEKYDRSMVLIGSQASFLFYSRVKKRARSLCWTIAPSTIAIDIDPLSGRSCNACNGCLVGCPNNSIWFAGDDLKRWVSLGLVDYRPGRIVKAIQESQFVTLQTIDSDNAVSEIHAEKVFLAAGAISTASIIVQSGFQDEVRIRDSSTAIGAAFHMGLKTNSSNFNHSLSQWWISASGEDSFLAQIYPPALDLIEKVMQRFKLPRVFSGVLRLIINRVHPLIAYLPSDKSGTIKVNKTARGVFVSGEDREGARKVHFRKNLTELSKLFFRSGYLMPLHTFQIKGPGGGYHHGSSFPHGTLSDHMGRPAFFKNVHIVDSSVLPVIPMGSITPTVMANAVRIARCVLDEENKR